jgi:hypothetical protein
MIDIWAYDVVGQHPVFPIKELSFLWYGSNSGDWAVIVLTPFSPTPLPFPKYSAMHVFWLVEFWDGRPGESHKCIGSIVFGLVLISASVSTGNLVTQKFQANAPLSTSQNSVAYLPALLSPSLAKNHALHYTAVDYLVLRMPWKLVSMTEGLSSLRFLGQLYVTSVIVIRPIRAVLDLVLNVEAACHNSVFFYGFYVHISATSFHFCAVYY